MLNFSRRDGFVILIYVLLIAVNFFVIGRLGLPESVVPTVRLAVILLNAFVVLYAYRDVLGEQWHAFRQRRWTKWLVIAGTFLVLWGLITLLRKLSAGGGDVVEEAAAEAMAPANDVKSMTLYAFIVGLVAMLVPLLSAVTEEVMFRHVLMFKHSRSRVTLGVMLVLSSVAFGLIHFVSLGSVAAAVPYIFAGLVLGGLYLWQKNIWYNIFAHMLFNGTNVAMALFGYLLQRFM